MVSAQTESRSSDRLTVAATCIDCPREPRRVAAADWASARLAAVAVAGDFTSRITTEGLLVLIRDDDDDDDEERGGGGQPEAPAAGLAAMKLPVVAVAAQQKRPSPTSGGSSIKTSSMGHRLKSALSNNDVDLLLGHGLEAPLGGLRLRRKSSVATTLKSFTQGKAHRHPS